MTRKLGTVLTDQEKQKIVNLLKDEVEVDFIVERMNVCKQTIYNIAKEAGFKFPHGRVRRNFDR